MTQNAKSIGRRELLQRGATIAAVAAIPAVGFPIRPTKAQSGADGLNAGDAELRRLWAKYLEQLARLDDAELAHKPVRDALDAEWYPLVKSSPWASKRRLSLSSGKSTA